MASVIHFEIHAQDTARAQKFYRGLFGWSFSKWGEEEYWLIEANPGESIGGLLLRRSNPPVPGQAVNSFVSTIGIDNLDESLEMALSYGADIAVPKVAVPNIGWLAYVTDTEGNIFGLMQLDSSAA